MVANMLDRLRLRVTPAGPTQKFPQSSTDGIGEPFWRGGTNAETTDYFATGWSQADPLAAGASYVIASQYIGVVPGQWIGFAMDAWALWQPGVSYTITFDYQTSFIPTSHAQHNVPTGQPTIPDTLPRWSAKQISKVEQVPAGKNYAQVIVTMTNSGAPGASLRRMYLAPATFINDPSQDVASLLIAAGPQRDLTGEAITISTSRGGQLKGVTDTLEAGSLKATVKGANMDPAVNPALRPGGIVTCEGFGASGWNRIFTGKITDCDADYSDGETKVTLEAVDYVSVLANTSAPVVKGAGAPPSNFRDRVTWLMSFVRNASFAVTDSAASGLPVELTKQDSGSVLDGLLLARDTEHGTLYVDRSGQLIGRAANSPPATVATWTFSDNAGDAGANVAFYTDMHESYSTKACVNDLNVAVKKIGEEVSYGPYRNVASIGAWDENEDTVTVNDGVPATHAAYFLKLYPSPKRFVDSVTLNVSDDVTPGVAPELYDAIRVKRAGLSDSTVRLLRIEHTIRATRDGSRGRWITTFHTRQLEGTTAVTVTLPAAITSSDPKYPESTEGNQSPAAKQPHARRELTADNAVAANAVVSVPYNLQLIAEQITWDAANRWFVIPKAGRYLISAWTTIFGTNGAWTQGRITVNGANVGGPFMQPGAGAGGLHSFADVLQLAAGDHVQITFTSGFAFTMAGTGGDHRTGVAITYLGG